MLEAFLAAKVNCHVSRLTGPDAEEGSTSGISLMLLLRDPSPFAVELELAGPTGMPVAGSNSVASPMTSASLSSISCSSIICTSSSSDMAAADARVGGARVAAAAADGAAEARLLAFESARACSVSLASWCLTVGQLASARRAVRFEPQRMLCAQDSPPTAASAANEREKRRFKRCRRRRRRGWRPHRGGMHSGASGGARSEPFVSSAARSERTAAGGAVLNISTAAGVRWVIQRASFAIIGKHWLMRSMLCQIAPFFRS